MDKNLLTSWSEDNIQCEHTFSLPLSPNKIRLAMLELFKQYTLFDIKIRVLLNIEATGMEIYLENSNCIKTLEKDWGSYD
jgi:hypothetical protein